MRRLVIGGIGILLIGFGIGWGVGARVQADRSFAYLNAKVAKTDKGDAISRALILDLLIRDYLKEHGHVD